MVKLHTPGGHEKTYEGAGNCDQKGLSSSRPIGEIANQGSSNELT